VLGRLELTAAQVTDGCDCEREVNGIGVEFNIPHHDPDLTLDLYKFRTDVAYRQQMEQAVLQVRYENRNETIQYVQN
jgi:hypothetical protein